MSCINLGLSDIEIHFEWTFLELIDLHMYVLNITNTFSKAFKSPAAEVTYIIINIKTEILVIFFFVCVFGSL